MYLLSKLHIAIYRESEIQTSYQPCLYKVHQFIGKTASIDFDFYRTQAMTNKTQSGPERKKWHTVTCLAMLQHTSDSGFSFTRDYEYLHKMWSIMRQIPYSVTHCSSIIVWSFQSGTLTLKFIVVLFLRKYN